MLKPIRSVAATLLAASALLVAGEVRADHPAGDAAASESFWPRWRGPLDTGVSPAGDPPITWSEGENLCWKLEVPGSGHASPIVWGDAVYLLTAVEESETAPKPVRFMVLAVDRESGEIRWQRTARTAVPHEGTHRTATWASASAVTDGEVLIASFGSNGIYAYGLDGELRWSVDLGDMETRNAFGEGASPVLHGDIVVVNWDHEGSSFIVALDRDSGEEIWRVERDEPTSWSTPVIVAAGERTQVVVSATNRVRAYDLESGEILWETGGMTVNTVPTPPYGNGLLYAMSGFRGNALLAIRPAGSSEKAKDGPQIVWSHDRDTSYVPSALLYDEHLYFLKSNGGILSNLDARTGKVFFGPERLDGVEGVYASPVGAAGRVYITSQNGATLVIAKGPELEVLAVNRLDDAFDASAAIAGDQLFLRGRRSLYCLEEEGGG